MSAAVLDTHMKPKRVPAPHSSASSMPLNPCHTQRKKKKEKGRKREEKAGADQGRLLGHD